ncbi:MAG TPA: restriction endonuclease [Puia sp.]|nr:restriction endonuclease [Puia sp.]
MPKYNYEFLSPLEFESLAKDLIERKEGKYFEIFKEGKDSGIDLRHITSDNEIIIVQCKRYKDDFGYLFNSLQKEAEKAKKLSPDRYILITSVGLTPHNKDVIQTLFHPIIKATGDIISRDEIDALLAVNEDIERKHYKLWLSSTSILQRIIHSKTYNQSSFELDAIHRQLKYYVPNESFDKAVKIIDQNNYIILSGVPGIGKTTLARMLVIYYLAKGFEEFIYLNEHINEAYQYFLPEKKQLFFYDDFLGTNFLHDHLVKNEDSEICKFIEKVSQSEEKIILFTTREYILKQAESIYPSLNNSVFSSKIILDINAYTIKIKGQILFNHLYFSSLPAEYISNILENSNYLKIISHPNYTPRIVDILTKNKAVWGQIKVSDFFKSFISYFDDPDLLYKNIFEEKISDFSRIILLAIAISGQPILLEDLTKTAISFLDNFFQSNAFSLLGKEIRKSLHELEGTFIITEVDAVEEMAISFANPSVLDFLIHYIQNDKYLTERILKSTTFFNQVNELFSPRYSEDSSFTVIRSLHPIELSAQSTALLKGTLINNFERYEPTTKIRKDSTTGLLHWVKDNDNRFYWLDEISRLFDLEKEVPFRELLIKETEAINYAELTFSVDFSSKISLLKKVEKYTSYDIASYIVTWAKLIKSYRDLELFCFLDYYFHDSFKKAIGLVGLEYLQNIAMPLCEDEFIKVVGSGFHSQDVDLMSRFFHKAEAERICDEINAISRSLSLSIYLDSDYFKELVREELIRRSKERGEYEKDRTIPPDVLDKEAIEFLKELFASMIYPE